ncbi:MAG: type I restriction-modification enzyme R subunit C-terminal domain-containing protein, partial [Cyanobacteriota bacterium]
YYIKGRPVQVLTERVEYLDEQGKLVTESLRDYSRRLVRQQYADLDRFLRRWRGEERKQVVLQELAEEGLLLEALQEEVGRELDPFDLICHIAYDQPPLSRAQRAARLRRDVFSRYGPQARAVLEALLEKYATEGVVDDLDNVKILAIPPFSQMGTQLQLIREFGGKAGFERAVHELQSELYREAA